MGLMNCEDNITPIIIAANKDHLEIVKYLRRRGANMEVVNMVRLIKCDIFVCRLDIIF